jgi:hypothetical protein
MLYYGIQKSGLADENHEREAQHVNCPSYSFMRFVVPFSTKCKLRDELTQSKSNKMRHGRLLEMMDFISGRVAYKHCYNEFYVKSSTNVTASVDGLQFFDTNHSVEEDIILDGYITWTGNFFALKLNREIFNGGPSRRLKFPRGADHQFFLPLRQS